MSWNLIVRAKDDVAAAIIKAHAEARDKHPGASRRSMEAIEPDMQKVAKAAAALAAEYAPGQEVEVTVGGTDAKERYNLVHLEVRRAPLSRLPRS